ncbi:MAG: hypothetical protein U1E93_11210 [Alphaproteobacteria bacterium]
MASPAHVRVAGPLQALPLASAPNTGTVKAGAAVDIVARKGFWAQVRGGGAAGWLKLTRLSLDSGGGVGDIAALASGRTGSGNVVSASADAGWTRPTLPAPRPTPPRSPPCPAPAKARRPSSPRTEDSRPGPSLT